MFTDTTQQRVERSIFEGIRKVVLSQGYIPDIANGTRYPSSTGLFSNTAQNNWNTDIDNIIAAKGWAVEVFGASDAFAKGMKRVPRVVIVPQRIMPGDLGFAPGLGTIPDPNIPGGFLNIPFPDTSANLHFDIHLISASQEQSRFLNSLIATVLGHRRYLTFEDNVNERFFIRNYNYSNISDTNDGVEENVYSYEVPDLYLFPESGPPIHIVPIVEINTDIIIGYTSGNIEEDEEATGESVLFTVIDNLIIVDPTSERIIMGETPTGTINGTNKVFLVANDFIVGKVQVFLNGLLLKRGVHFTSSGLRTITFIDAPEGTDEILVNYITLI